MDANTICITAVGAFCPVGLDAEQVSASVRAGIPRKAESSIIGRHWEPLVLGYLPQDVLPSLVDKVEAGSAGMTSLQRRLLQLAGAALAEVFEGVKSEAERARVPLLLAGPRPAEGRDEILTQRVLDLLPQQASVSFDAKGSKLYTVGHAGLFQALVDARAILQGGTANYVVVGGVDSYVDPYRLELLEEENRLHRAGVMDGFTPGEGAACALLGTARQCQRDRRTPLAVLSGVGLGMEPGHRYSDDPYLGDGLANAFSSLFAAAPVADAPVKTVLAGFNGENFHGKEWGVAVLRNKESFAEGHAMEHPAEYAGDMGAALAPVMLATGALWLSEHKSAGPVLVWASSDAAERGAALLRPAA
jgi:3-oxoacyl-[acyl-carrier-protein] synthase-1